MAFLLFFLTDFFLFLFLRANALSDLLKVRRPESCDKTILHGSAGSATDLFNLMLSYNVSDSFICFLQS